MVITTLDGDVVERKWRVNVYVDESKPANGNPWLYIGAVVIPKHCLDAATRLLNEDRNASGYHRELHFQRIKRHDKADLAKRWLHRILYGSERTFYFHLLGIDTRRVNRSRFGYSDIQMYSRLFRTAVAGAVKGFAMQQTPVVEHLFHDSGDMESHDVFAWHSQWRMEQDNQITFMTDRVTFVESDHSRELTHPEASHLIQLADIAVGAFRQCLDASSSQDAKTELGLEVRPLLARLMNPNTQGNPNSRFDFLHRVSVSFWPNPQENATDFYSSRDLLCPNTDGSVQLRLIP